MYWNKSYLPRGHALGCCCLADLFWRYWSDLNLLSMWWFQASWHTGDQLLVVWRRHWHPREWRGVETPGYCCPWYWCVQNSEEGTSGCPPWSLTCCWMLGGIVPQQEMTGPYLGYCWWRWPSFAKKAWLLLLQVAHRKAAGGDSFVGAFF